MQEVAGWNEDLAGPGWEVFTRRGNPIAALVLAEPAAFIRAVEINEIATGLVMGGIGVVSACLADSSKPLVQFEETVKLVWEILLLLRSRGATYSIVGSDSQTELPCEFMDVTGLNASSRAGWRRCSAERAGRLRMLLDRAKEFDLKAANA